MLHLESCITGSATYIPDETADLVIADPPYNLNYNGTAFTSTKRPRFSPIANDKLSDDEYRRFMLDWMREAHRILKYGRHIYVYIDWRNYGSVASWLEFSGFTIKNCVVWDKVQYGMGHHYRYQHEFIIMATKGKHKVRRTGMRTYSDIWPFKRVPGNQTCHPHEKPLAMLERIVTNSSEPGELVVDLFAGSGVGPAAAELHGRKWIAFEVDPQYYDIAQRRVSEIRDLPRANTPKDDQTPVRGRQRTQATPLRRRSTDTDTLDSV